MNPLPGTTIGGRYRIEGILGEGGMGTVFIAHDLRLERRIAVKFLHDSLSAADPTFAERFRKEAIAACRIRHPAVVEIYDADVHDGSPWMAMELLEGEPLSNRLARGPLTVEETVWVALQTLEGLVAVHEAGFVHRDLKPDNLFLQQVTRQKAQLKLLDFGIVKEIESRSGALTQTGSTLGTPWYVSPEQAAGSKKLDHRSDLYSLAIVLFECLTLRRPFEAESFGELVSAFYTDVPTSLAEARPGTPPELDAVLRACLHVDPGERPYDAQTLIQQFHALPITASPLTSIQSATPAPIPLTPVPPAPDHATGGRGETNPLGTLAIHADDRPDAPGFRPGTAPLAGTMVTPHALPTQHVVPAGTAQAQPSSKRSPLVWIASFIGIASAMFAATLLVFLFWPFGESSDPDETPTLDSAPSRASILEPVGLATDPAAGPPQVVIGASEQVDGSGQLATEVIDWALLRRRDALMRCYESALVSDASLAGPLYIRFTIGPDGLVNATETVHDGLNVSLDACVLSTFGGLRFAPGPEGGAASFELPVHFGFDASRSTAYPSTPDSSTVGA